MSHTIAHRPHVHHHVPLTPVFAVIVAIAIAAVVIWAINQPRTTSRPARQPGRPGADRTAGSGAGAREPGVPPRADARAPERGHSQAYLAGRLHQVEGSTLDPLSTTPSTRSGERLHRGVRRPLTVSARRRAAAGGGPAGPPPAARLRPRALSGRQHS